MYQNDTIYFRNIRQLLQVIGYVHSILRTFRFFKRNSSLHLTFIINNISINTDTIQKKITSQRFFSLISRQRYILQRRENFPRLVQRGESPASNIDAERRRSGSRVLEARQRGHRSRQKNTILAASPAGLPNLLPDQPWNNDQGLRSRPVPQIEH